MEAKRINLAAIPLAVLLVRCILMMHSDRDLRPEDYFQPEHARFSDACPTAGTEMTSRRQYVTNPFPKTW